MDFALGSGLPRVARFSVVIEGADDVERINAASNNGSFFPVKFAALQGREIDMSFDGMKRGDLCLWKTRSRSGFASQPKRLEDVVTVRFPIYGAISRRDRRDEYSFDQGHGLIVPFREMDTMRTSANINLINCSFGHEMVLRYMRFLDGDDVGRSPAFRPLVDTKLPAVGIFKAALLALHERIQSLDPANDLFFPILEEMLVFQLIGCWPRQAPAQAHRQTASNKVLRVALEYIDANLSEPIGVSEVARAAGTSVRNVQIAFKSNLGVTPVQYIINCRLDRVHDALRQDHTSGYISQIAHMWGFYHPADFARRYKARFGETPSESRIK